LKELSRLVESRESASLINTSHEIGITTDSPSASDNDQPEGHWQVKATVTEASRKQDDHQKSIPTMRHGDHAVCSEKEYSDLVLSDAIEIDCSGATPG
jgi:hypothetical protein